MNYLEQELVGRGYMDGETGQISPSLREALQDVYDWQFSYLSKDSFAYKLMQCISKADKRNLERLREGFPAEVSAYEFWFYTPKSSDRAWFEQLLRESWKEEAES